MMIDWSCVPVHTIDLAVLPSARVGAAGLHLMRAWLETCDRMQVAASLNVMPDNPSRRLYGFLGFEETEPLAFPLPMLRRPRTRARADRADSDSITAEHVDL
jgi:hypothetical protein